MTFSNDFRNVSLLLDNVAIAAPDTAADANSQPQLKLLHMPAPQAGGEPSAGSYSHVWCAALQGMCLANTRDAPSQQALHSSAATHNI